VWGSQSGRWNEQRVHDLTYIAAGELAGERVAGLVEEDGDELERREQERPPQLEKKKGKTPQTTGETETPLVSRGVARRIKATGGSIGDGEVGTHEEDDDGGDADGGDEDPLVVAAAALQLPVRRHPRPAAAAVDLPPARIRGRGNEGEQQQTETARVGGRLGRTENVRGAGTESGRRGTRGGGRACPRRVWAEGKF